MSESATDLPKANAARPSNAIQSSYHATLNRFALPTLVVGLAVLGGVAISLARGFSFIVDEWDILGLHVHGDFLTPYNGHLSIIPIAMYQGLAHTGGIGSYWPYFLVSLTVFLAIPVAFFFTHRREVAPGIVAVCALGIAWSWAAQGNILYGFLVNFNLPLLMLFLAWPLIRRDSFRGDLLTILTLAVALATSSNGVVVAFAIGVELLLLRVPFRRLLRFAPPVIAWCIWWIFRHDPTKPASFGDKAAYAWHMGVAILAGFSLGWKPGAFLSAAVIIALVWTAWRRWKTVDAHVVAIGATLVFFIVLSSYSRAGDIALNPPDAARYVWVGNLLIISGLLWCVRGRQVPLPALGAVAAVVVLGAVGLVGHMNDYRSYVLNYTARTRPVLLAVENAGPHADRSRILPLNLIPVTVGDYLDLVHAVGSPVTGSRRSPSG